MVEILPANTYRSTRSDRISGDADVVPHLRAATWPIHERLHRHPMLRPLTARQPTLEGYRAAVRALYGFVAPMERLLGPEGAGRAARAPLLLADLKSLDETLCGGAPVLGELPLPLADDLPAAGTIAARLGCRWVLDGSAHG